MSMEDPVSADYDTTTSVLLRLCHQSAQETAAGLCRKGKAGSGCAARFPAGTET